MSDQKICPTCGTEYPLSERFCPRDGTALRSANAQADLLGAVIADRYHILKKLGEGGMGTVYLAEHVKMGRKSALKVMNPGMNTDPDAIARFNREASNASRLSHPNICGIYDFGETSEGLIYLAMEFIEGSSLTSLIEKGGSLPAPRAASIVHQTADALQVAHDAGIVHRDLKPDNIMVAKHRDGSDQVKVVDFGIAKASSSDAQKVTKTGLVVGTPEYMSPEQLAGDKLDGRSDIYSLGLVAFNCLTGALPFAAETAQEAMIMRLTDRPRTLAEVAPDRPWPAAVQATLDKALARDAAERYQSAAQFGREFAAAVAEMPLTQAVEAGTLVMNASRGPIATQELPPTQVHSARPSAKTQPMESPAAARKPAGAGAAGGAAATRATTSAPAAAKSGLPMIIGVGGGLAVAGVAAWLVFGKPAASPGGDPNAGTASPPQQVATAPADSAPANVGGGTTGGVTGGGAPTGGDAGSKKAAPIEPLSAPISAPQPPAKSAPGTANVPVPSGPSAADQLARWLTQVNDPATTPAQMNRIIGEVEELRPSLSGLQLADSWWIEFVARASKNDSGACRAAKQVAELHTDPRKSSVGSGFTKDADNKCPP